MKGIFNIGSFSKQLYCFLISLKIIWTRGDRIALLLKEFPEEQTF